MSDLNILFPKPVSALVEGRPVLIKPVQVQHFEAFGKAAGSLLSLMENATPAEIYAYATKSGAMAEILGSCTSLSTWRRKRLGYLKAVYNELHKLDVIDYPWPFSRIKPIRLQERPLGYRPSRR